MASNSKTIATKDKSEFYQMRKGFVSTFVAFSVINSAEQLLYAVINEEVKAPESSRPLIQQVNFGLNKIPTLDTNPLTFEYCQCSAVCYHELCAKVNPYV